MKLHTLLNPYMLAVALLLAFTLCASPAYADHHDTDHDDDHHAATAIDVDAVLGSGGSLEQLEALVSVLQQLITLLSQQVEMADMHSEHDHALKIWTEVHSNTTHVHIDAPGEDLKTFFLDGVDYTDHDAVVAGIVANTDYDEETVNDAVTFYSGELDENGDSMDEMSDDHDHEHEDGEEEDLSGIHIMADGSVMLGNGEVLDDATVTEDGMIMLADGDLVEPAMDLRDDGDMDDTDHMDHDE